MCRNIRTLFNFDPPVTPEEVRAASLQFVRKISGVAKPSKANEGTFEVANNEDKKRGRLNIISHLLSRIPYEPLELPDVELPKRQRRRRTCRESVPW